MRGIARTFGPYACGSGASLGSWRIGGVLGGVEWAVKDSVLPLVVEGLPPLIDRSWDHEDDPVADSWEGLLRN